MAEILVKPIDLLNAANDLRAHAKKMQEALNAVNNEIQSLGIGRFEGERANSLRARYNRIQEQINRVKPLIDHFAQDLEDASARFRAADRA